MLGEPLDEIGTGPLALTLGTPKLEDKKGTHWIIGGNVPVGNILLNVLQVSLVKVSAMHSSAHQLYMLTHISITLGL